MKKFVSLLLALVLCLSMVAFAEPVANPSPRTEAVLDSQIRDENGNVISAMLTSDLSTLAPEAQQALTDRVNQTTAALSDLPDTTPSSLGTVLGKQSVSVLEQVAQNGKPLVVAETVACAAINFGTAPENTKNVVAKLRFTIKFKAGSLVAISLSYFAPTTNLASRIGVAYADEELQWVTFMGTANEEGGVDVELPVELMQQIEQSGKGLILTAICAEDAIDTGAAQ